jgi:hypothetical protein
VSALDGHQPFLAVLAALTGAAITALGTALQQRATHTTPVGGAGMRLVLSLARKPAWLGSLGLIAVGFCCYLVALAAGTIGLVLLGERVNTTPLAMLIEVVACLALFCGIGMVARRGAQLNEAHWAAVAGRDRAALSWG